MSNLGSFIVVACAVLVLGTGRPAPAAGRGETVTPNFEMAIPNIPGKSLRALVVDYAPGGASDPHRHMKSAFIYAYVVSGAIESQVNDEAKRVYRAGESWHETPGSTHRISRNASTSEPAKLLAVFVVDADEQVLTSPIADPAGRETGK
jgi:quercetin dioxygenase-like cupin family protein